MGGQTVAIRLLESDVHRHSALKPNPLSNTAVLAGTLAPEPSWWINPLCSATGMNRAREISSLLGVAPPGQDLKTQTSTGLKRPLRRLIVDLQLAPLQRPGEF